MRSFRANESRRACSFCRVQPKVCEASISSAERSQKSAKLNKGSSKAKSQENHKKRAVQK